MSENIQISNTIDGFRAQILANLQVFFEGPNINQNTFKFDILTTKYYRKDDPETAVSGGEVFAWVARKCSSSPNIPPEIFLKGPGASSNAGALEGLLEATNEILGKKLMREFEAFEGECCSYCGNGAFLKDEVWNGLGEKENK